MNRANEDYFIEKITDERNVSRTGLELRKMEKDKMDVIMNDGMLVCLYKGFSHFLGGGIFCYTYMN